MSTLVRHHSWFLACLFIASVVGSNVLAAESTKMKVSNSPVQSVGTASAYPSHVVSAELSGSVGWSLYQNSGSKSVQWIGPLQKTCETTRGAEPENPGRRSYVEMCRSFDGAVVSVGRRQTDGAIQKLVGWAMDSSVSVKSRRGWYRTVRKEGNTTYITDHVQDVSGTISLANTMRITRTADPLWLYVERPWPTDGKKSSGEWSYVIQISHPVTRKLYFTYPLDDNLFGGARGELGDRTNCCAFFELTKLIDTKAEGVAIGQQFEVKLITQGAFDNGLDGIKDPARQFGSMVLLGLLQEAP